MRTHWRHLKMCIPSLCLFVFFKSNRGTTYFSYHTTHSDGLQQSPSCDVIVLAGEEVGGASHLKCGRDSCRHQSSDVLQVWDQWMWSSLSASLSDDANEQLCSRGLIRLMGSPGRLPAVTWHWPGWGCACRWLREKSFHRCWQNVKLCLSKFHVQFLSSHLLVWVCKTWCKKIVVWLLCSDQLRLLSRYRHQQVHLY